MFIQPTEQLNGAEITATHDCEIHFYNSGSVFSGKIVSESICLNKVHIWLRSQNNVSWKMDGSVQNSCGRAAHAAALNFNHILRPVQLAPWSTLSKLQCLLLLYKCLNHFTQTRLCSAEWSVSGSVKSRSKSPTSSSDKHGSIHRIMEKVMCWLLACRTPTFTCDRRSFSPNYSVLLNVQPRFSFKGLQSSKCK